MLTQVSQKSHSLTEWCLRSTNGTLTNLHTIKFCLCCLMIHENHWKHLVADGTIWTTNITTCELWMKCSMRLAQIFKECQTSDYIVIWIRVCILVCAILPYVFIHVFISFYCHYDVLFTMPTWNCFVYSLTQYSLSVCLLAIFYFKVYSSWKSRIERYIYLCLKYYKVSNPESKMSK